MEVVGEEFKSIMVEQVVYELVGGFVEAGEEFMTAVIGEVGMIRVLMMEEEVATAVEEEELSCIMGGGVEVIVRGMQVAQEVSLGVEVVDMMRVLGEVLEVEMVAEVRSQTKEGEGLEEEGGKVAEELLV